MATKKTQFNTKKPKSGSFADFLYKDRFYNNKGKKKVVNKKSVVEYSGLSALQEKIDTNKRVELDIENDTNLSVEEFKNLIDSYIQILNSLDYSLSIPPRVPFSNIKKEHYKYVKLAAFSYWKSTKGDLIFERNLETWRQFWITCERATIIAQVIDSRNPNLFFNNDICKAFPNKKHLALCNKSDLIVNYDSLKEFFTDIDFLTYSSKTDDNSLNLEIIIDSKFKELSSLLLE
ncbi:LSG1 [Hepatospora eriocheir]|uniref:LSG1 n=1 Tax=Hepatospora eriocheir TaxID=1081669 RepID=A0A1X0QJ86_9MICR|nr:LSG1 [Hepatospora eriocheir]